MSAIDFQNGFVCGMATRGLVVSSTPQHSNPWVRPIDWVQRPMFDPAYDEIYLLANVNENGSNYFAFSATGLNLSYSINGSTYTNLVSNSIISFSIQWSDVPAGNICSAGYKTVWLRIYAPRGQLTGINLNVRNTALSSNKFVSGWLEYYGNCQLMSQITISGDTQEIIHSMLASFEHLGQTTITTTRSMFFYCYGLKNVNSFDTSKVTNMYNMFGACCGLNTVPLFDTSSVTNMYSMFGGCDNLDAVPLFDTSKVTTMAAMFSGCYNLNTVPLFNTSNVTNMGAMFNYCYSLSDIPLFNTSNITDMGSMFSTCSSLNTVPSFDISKVTNMSSMFNKCSILTKILQPSNNVTNIDYLYQNCKLITEIVIPDASKIVSVNQSITGTPSLKKLILTGWKGHTTSSNGLKLDNPNMLSAQALNDLFTSLGVRTQAYGRITITGSLGAATCDKTIATNKGWTIIG